VQSGEERWPTCEVVESQSPIRVRSILSQPRNCDVESGTLQSGSTVGATLWPVQHEFRLKVIRTFVDNPIVLFPQSLHFTSERSAIESRTTLAGHGDVTLLVRDRQSRDLARTALGVDTKMCPDLAHWLTPSARRQGKGTVFLLRTDQESTGLSALAASGGTDTCDWSDAFQPPFPRRVSLSMWYTLHRKATKGLDTRARYRGAAELAASKVRDRLASDRLAIGLSLLDPYDVVVTDRLHGHLLALLLGKKTVTLDNSYGKVHAYYDAWTSELPGSYWADSLDEALSIAESVAG